MAVANDVTVNEYDRSGEEIIRTSICNVYIPVKFFPLFDFIQ